jgi:hypothetical protein
LQGLPKFTQIGIFGRKVVYHLETLVLRAERPREGDGADAVNVADGGHARPGGRQHPGAVHLERFQFRASEIVDKMSDFFKKKEVARGWGANPGPLSFIYFHIFHHFTAEPQRLPK